jgi:hypothetical protein
MFCSKCGKELPDYANFCASCGNRIKPNTPVIPAGAVPSPVPGPDYRPSPGAGGKSNTGLIVALCAAGMLLLAGIVFAVIYFKDRLPGRRLADNEPVATATARIIEPEITPAPSATPAEMPKNTPRYVLPTEEPTETNVFSDDIMNFFSLTAFDSYDYVIKRWEQPVKIELIGDYTDKDYENLVYNIDILNSMEMLPAISIVNSGGNFFVYFVPKKDFKEIFADYNADYPGYYTYSWDDTYQLTEFVMATATDDNTQEEKNHLVLEMLMRGLGLLGDGSDRSDSILYYDSSEQAYAEVDYYMILMMYSQGITSGMDVSSALACFSE